MSVERTGDRSSEEEIALERGKCYDVLNPPMGEETEKEIFQQGFRDLNIH